MRELGIPALARQSGWKALELGAGRVLMGLTTRASVRQGLWGKQSRGLPYEILGDRVSTAEGTEREEVERQGDGKPGVPFSDRDQRGKKQAGGGKMMIAG